MLLAISVWMRLKLSESPEFERLKAEGKQSKAPFKEAFGEWPNLRLVLIALVAIMFAQGAVWYTAFFYVQTFMERFLRAPPETINLLMLAAVAASAFLYVFFGWLSDRVGRKTVMLFGMTLMLVAYFPGFHLLAQTLNPALAEAEARTPVVVIADPADCKLQFDPVGRGSFLSSCDIAKSTLANAGISYTNQAGAPGQAALVRVGEQTIPSASAAGLAPEASKAVKASVEARIKAALTSAGYPEKADPERMNLYGPIAACLVELFPTKVRYTALSLPYHIGTGWVGGFVPFTAFAIVTATGQLYSGLWYPFAFTAISVVVCLLLLPETRGKRLDT